MQHVIYSLCVTSIDDFLLLKQEESIHELKIKSKTAIVESVDGKKTMHDETGKDRNEETMPGLIHAERGEHPLEKVILCLAKH